MQIIQEDCILENIQFLVYLFCALFTLSIAAGFFKRKQVFLCIFYSILFFGFIFICGEEISWGSRIFNVRIPEYLRIQNMQKELTLHNLGIVHYLTYVIFLAVGFFGTFTQLLLPAKIKTKYNSVLNYLVPGPLLSMYFLPVFVIYLYYCIYGALALLFGITPLHIENGSFIVWRDQEPAEFILSFGFLFFMIGSKYREAVKKLPNYSAKLCFATPTN